MMGEKRLQSKPAPSYSFKEGDLIRMNQQLHELTVSHNAVGAFCDELQKFGILEKSQQLGWMHTVILRALDDTGKAIRALCGSLNERGLLSEEDFKGIDTFAPSEERIRALSHQVQEKDMGFKAKEGEQIAELGDIIICNYQLYDDNDKEISTENQDMGYEIGSPGLPEIVSQGVIGMRPGELRFFEQVIFSKGLIPDGLEGRPLKMKILCKGLRTLSKK